MESNVNLNASAPVSFNANRSSANDDNKTVSNPIEMKKDGDTKLKAALVALGVLGAAGAIGYGIYRHKNPVTALKDFDFKKIQDGTSKYTGKVKGSLSNGDKIVMEYKDGILQKSTRSGKVNFEKVYSKLENGESQVVKTVNGKSETINLTQIKNNVKKANDSFDDLLAKKDTLTLDKFKEEASKLEYMSKAKQAKIDDVITGKQKAIEDAAKARAAQQKAIQDAQKLQDANIQKMTNPSGLSHDDWQKMIDENEAARKVQEEASARLAKEEAIKKAQEAQDKALKQNLSNAKAMDSARTFMVADEGDFSQRLAFIKDAGKIESYLGDGTPVAEIEAAYKKLKPETISLLSDNFIGATIANPANSDIVAQKLLQMEQDFTPEQLKRLIKNDFDGVGLRTGYLSGCCSAADLLR